MWRKNEMTISMSYLFAPPKDSDGMILPGIDYTIVRVFPGKLFMTQETLLS